MKSLCVASVTRKKKEKEQKRKRKEKKNNKARLPAVQETFFYLDNTCLLKQDTEKNDYYYDL